MTTSYGYGGEFSSDEDVDKLDQLADRASNKPSKGQIELIINSIKSQPTEEEVKLTDDQLAGILDYYKTPRGPVVDSTRALYKKIILRQIRGDQQETATNGDSHPKATNGNGTNVDTQKSNNNNNNNDINLISKRQLQLSETPSSDEDDPIPMDEPKLATVRKNPNAPNVLHYNELMDSSNIEGDKLEEMEVDSEEVELAQQPRTIEIIDLDEDEESEKEDQESSSDSESELEKSTEVVGVLDTTSPIVDSKRKSHVTSTPINFKVTPKRAEALKKSATKEANADVVQTPFRRSQRVAATRLSKSPSKSNQIVSSSGERVIESVDTETRTSRTGKASMIKFFILALVVALLAFLIFNFKGDILNSTKRVMRNVDIKF